MAAPHGDAALARQDGPRKEPERVLTEEQNQALAQVGPGTLMGELLRRYWMPIAAVAELDETPVKAVRLLGEDLVLYKDKSGTYGLVDRHCPHRRADLSLRLGRGVRPALQLPRLAVRRARRVPAAAVRGDRPPGRALQGPHHRSRPTRSRRRRACSGPTWGRRRRRSCRPGSRSPGRTASCRSCSPRSPATGSSARRTRSTRCTSSGCTPTGRACCSGQTDGPKPPTHLQRGLRRVRVRLHLPAHPGGPVRERRAVDGRARLPLAELRCSPAATSSGACRSTTTPRSASAGSSTACPDEMEPFEQERDPLLVQPDQGRADRPLDHHATS